MNNPKVSVIIPVFNTENYLDKCLSSVINQTFFNLEIICIDDGSTDNSLKLLSKYEMSDPRIIVCSVSNHGVSFARNLGIEIASGDYLMFVDSDDWIEDNTIEVMLKSLLTNPDFDTVMCSYIKEYKKPIVNHIFEEKKLLLKGTALEERFYRRLFGLIDEELAKPETLDLMVSPCMQLFKFEHCKDIRFQDIKQIGSFEDGLFQMDYYKKSSGLIYVDYPFYHYRKNNVKSLTAKFNPLLLSQRQTLYKLIEDRISTYSLPESFSKALNNRIALETVSIGLNYVQSHKRFRAKSADISTILNQANVRRSLEGLELRWFDFKWRLFFQKCQKNRPASVTFLLLIMNVLRKRKG